MSHAHAHALPHASATGATIPAHASDGDTPFGFSGDLLNGHQPSTHDFTPPEKNAN